MLVRSWARFIYIWVRSRLCSGMVSHVFGTAATVLGTAATDFGNGRERFWARFFPRTVGLGERTQPKSEHPYSKRASTG